MLLNLNLNEHIIMHVRFFRKLKYIRFFMNSQTKSINLQKEIRLHFRSKLFPYNRRFMDKRIDSYLSLFYECELYSVEDLCKDICDCLYSQQSYSVEASIDVHLLKSEPIYKQLTLF